MYRQQFFVIANILMLVDGLILIATGYPAYILSLDIKNGGLVMAWFDFLASVLFLIVANNYIMGKMGFYSEKRFPTYWAMIASLLKGVSLDFIALSVVAFLLGIRPFPRVFVVAYFVMALVSLAVTRIILYYYLDRRTRTAFNSRQILLIGTEKRILSLANALETQRSWGHQIAGFLSVDGQRTSLDLKINRLGDLNDFDHVLQNNHIDEVIFALPKDFPIDLETYMHKCEGIGVNFRIVPGLFDTDQPRLKVETLQGIPTLASYSWSATASGLLYKRILDLIAGFVGYLMVVYGFSRVTLVLGLVLGTIAERSFHQSLMISDVGGLIFLTRPIAFAFVLVLINVPVLPVAIGIYLPFTLGTPIFFGGIIRYITNRKIDKKFESTKGEETSEWELAIKQTEIKPKDRILRTGLLFSAGLIAGEALTGVIVAFIIITGLKITVFETPPTIPGLLIWLFIALLVFYIPLREIYNKDS